MEMRPIRRAAAEQPRAGALRRFFHLDLATLGLLLAPLAALAVAIAQPVDYDYWWHARTGEYIMYERAIPFEDPFAFTTAGEGWVDHEWLSQVAMFVLQDAFGYVGLFLFMFGLGLTAWWFIYRLLLSEGLGRFQAVLLSMAPLALGASHWRARPAMFTVVLLAFFVAELFAARRGDRRALWHLVPVLAIWANLHGGYVIGLAVIAVYAGAQFVQPVKRTPSWRHALMCGAGAFLLTGLNPYTWRLWLYPFTYFFGDNASLQVVDEWQSADFHESRSLPFALLLLGGLAVGSLGRRFDAFATALFVVFAALALQSMRHQPLFAIVWAPVMGASLADRFEWWRKRRPFAVERPSLHWPLLAGGSAMLVAAIVASPSGLPGRAAPVDGAQPYPAASAAYVRDHLAGERVFNLYEWGGYLIHELYPENKVFIDGRADLHGERVNDYRAMVESEGWERTFRRYGIRVAVLPPDVPLTGTLRFVGWNTAYEDETQVVLVHPDVPDTRRP